MGCTKVIAGALLAASMFGEETTIRNRPSLVAHEWGTFTSVAGPGGYPMPWAAFSGPGDLPCFVIRLGIPQLKGMTQAFVRMETPVLYFYPERAMTLSVQVDFPKGWITEWYPKASRVKPDQPMGVGGGRIEWSQVNVVPGETAALPTTEGPSHYYAARNTDSAMLRVGDQQEKLIFYRGLGNFSIPVRPQFNDDGVLEIRNTGAEPIPLVMVFENRGGKVGYRTAAGVTDTVKLDAPELDANPVEVHERLATALEGLGLYRKEAQAMVETWKDSWFEEGARVFYIVPRSTVDSVLPLNIDPMPTEIERVFVGRVEVLSPRVVETIETAVRQGDIQALAKFGRFLTVFGEQMRSRSAVMRSREAQSVLARAYTEIQKDFNAGGCVR